MRPLVLVLLLVLAGCTTAPPATSVPPSVAGLHWPVMLAYTTHNEPEPQRGNLMMAWSGTTFALSSPGESGMPFHSVVAGGTAYTTQLDMGWTSGPVGERVLAGRLSNRLLLWDLRALANEPSLGVKAVAHGSWLNVTGGGTLRSGSYDLALTFDVRSRDGVVVEAFVASPQGVESPYSFRPTTAPFPFEVAVPKALPEQQVDAQDEQVRGNHLQVIDLITAYANNHGKTLPETVDAQSLQVELVASGKPWPTNPYSGDAEQNRQRSGDFLWKRCTLTDGRYNGLAYDGPILQQTFGKNCG